MSAAIKIRRGFTLVEVLCVVVILGVSAAFVVPRLSQRDDLMAASMARNVMADVIYAQNRAVATRQIQYVRFDSTNQRYDVLSGLSPETFVTHPVNGGSFRVPLGAGRIDHLRVVSLAAASFDGQTCLAFDELGIPYACDVSTGVRSAMTAGTIRLSAGTYSLTITVEPFSGELRTN
jgi:prepilin-type N-terminal cleavage/methylation domain-containing protein